MLEAVPALEVLVDGVPMPEPEAQAFWKRFSEHMEAHRGDLAGFATAEGYASVHPELGPDGPRLCVSRSAAQQPYRNARPSRADGPSPPRGGSPKVHSPRSGGGRKPRKSRSS